MTDDATLGGYVLVHQRPPAFGAPDGSAYTAAAAVDEMPAPDGRYGAFLLFVRWEAGGPASKPGGHLETSYLTFAATPEDALAQLSALPLEDVKAHLDSCITGMEARP